MVAKCTRRGVRFLSSFNASSKCVFAGYFVFRGIFVFVYCVFEMCLRWVIRLRGEIRLRLMCLRGVIRLRWEIRLHLMCLRNVSSRGNSSSGRNSSSFNVSSKCVFASSFTYPPWQKCVFEMCLRLRAEKCVHQCAHNASFSQIKVPWTRSWWSPSLIRRSWPSDNHAVSSNESTPAEDASTMSGQTPSIAPWEDRSPVLHLKGLAKDPKTSHPTSQPRTY